MTRWSGLLLLLLLIGPINAEPLPITGNPVEGFTPVDRAIVTFMEQRDIRAGTVAIGRGGELLYQRGYGWRDADRSEPTLPTTAMRIASISKPITAAAVNRLIAAGRLAPSDHAFDLLGIEPPADRRPDPRLADITVQHLFNHQAGWDRSQGFDPMFHDPAIRIALKLDRTPTADDIIRFMLDQPLNFTPGERSAYSNFGYCVLGRLIERVTNRSYIDHIRTTIAEALGMTSLRLGRTAAKHRLEDEVSYPIPDGRLHVERMDAHGGLVCNAGDLCRFLDAYWIDGKPRRPGEMRDFTFFGAMPGTMGMVRQRPDGLNLAVLFNAWPKDYATIKGQLDRTLNRIEATTELTP